MYRRTFLAAAATAAACATSASQQAPRWQVGGFTKALQDLSFDALAEFAAGLGWDGIECAVRPGGHVLPERAADDLPRLVEALGKRRLTLLVMTTAVHDPSEPHTERLLRTAAGLGVTRYRLGQWTYQPDQPITRQLDAVKRQLTDLAALNRQLGLTGLFQNHSGRAMVGAPVWDIHRVIENIDPAQVGVQFDIGHATYEGGAAWETHFRLVRPWVGAVVMKDFTWETRPGRGGRARWHAIGTGMVDPAFWRLLKQSGWGGPVTLHFEYPTPGATDAERRQSLRDAMAADTRTLKGWLA